jgi:hypothetical protein
MFSAVERISRPSSLQNVSPCENIRHLPLSQRLLALRCVFISNKEFLLFCDFTLIFQAAKGHSRSCCTPKLKFEISRFELFSYSSDLLHIGRENSSRHKIRELKVIKINKSLLNRDYRYQNFLWKWIKKAIKRRKKSEVYYSVSKCYQRKKFSKSCQEYKNSLKLYDEMVNALQYHHKLTDWSLINSATCWNV